ncbi:MAG: T9SS type A sorting domain-containing protein [Crocinitomicaceae bacterium]|nr:T9SS type A sorting domain-containing protein [Crocinitomicaceae bacterium]
MKNTLVLLFFFSTLSFGSSSQCTVANNTGICAIVPGLIAQSFTANCDGLLQSVQFYSANTGTISGVTLNMYNANTPNGSPTYTQAFSNINIANPNDPVLFNITGSFPIVSGNQYTVEFNSGTFPMLGGGSYTGGDAFHTGNNTQLDFLFDIEVAQPLSLESLNQSKFNLYPNPSVGKVKISTDRDFKLEIVNLNGTVIQHHENVKEISINTSGVYFFRFIEGEIVTVEKVIIN